MAEGREEDTRGEMAEGREEGELREDVYGSFKQTMESRHGVDLKHEHWLQLFDPSRPGLPVPVGRQESDALADVTYTGDHRHLDILERITRKEFLPFVLTSYLRRTVEDPARWSVSPPVRLTQWAVETFCRVVQLFTTESLFQEPLLADPDTRAEFFQCCKREKCQELAVLVGALSRDWNPVAEVLKDAPQFRHHGFPSKLFWFCHKQGADPEALFNFLRNHFDRTPRCWLGFDPRLFGTEQMGQLAILCASERSLLNWQVFFLVRAGEWAAAMAIASNPQNQDVKSRALFLAAAAGRFSEAKALYESCSSADVLQEARCLIWEHSDFGSTEGVKPPNSRLMSYVTTALYLHYLHLTQRDNELFAIIQSAVLRPPEQGLEFAYQCIRNGLSTRYPDGERLCEDCIAFRRPKLLRMLLDAGAVHFQHYYRVVERRSVPASLVQEIEEGDPYLKTGVDNPSWLQLRSIPSLQQLGVLTCARLYNHLFVSSRDSAIDQMNPNIEVSTKLKFKSLNVYLRMPPFE